MNKTDRVSALMQLHAGEATDYSEDPASRFQILISVKQKVKWLHVPVRAWSADGITSWREQGKLS